MVKVSKAMGVVLLIFSLLISITACGSSTSPNNAADEEEQQEENNGENAAQDTASSQESEENSDAEEPSAAEGEAEVSGNNDALVIYFSRTGEQYVVGVIDKGNTAIVAEMIAEETGADLFEVLPAEDNYPMTYDELIDVAKQEQNEKARPAYAGDLPDISKYDTIFIGAPVWWGDWPMIMYTVFENNDFTGKTLIPFSTHEGSGLAGFDNKLASACPDSTVLEGLAIRGSDAQNNQDSVRNEVNDWLEAVLPKAKSNLGLMA